MSNQAAPEEASVYYGGQAVLEGVMIRGPEHMAVAVRHPKGHIVVHSEQLRGMYTGRARRIPGVRGVVVLGETLALGMRALSFSSRVALDEEDEKGEAVGFPEKAFWGTMAVSLTFVIGIFFAAPILLANLLELVDAHRAVIVIVEGVVRLGFFIIYIALISLLPDIRRVFQYHGAEHMTIHAYEAKQPLTIEEIRKYPKEHTRCGTSFLLVVVIVSLLTFFAWDLLVDEGLLVRVSSRVFLVPPIAAASYEILRFGAKFRDYAVVRAMFAPNIALQALTTKVPDDTQIEVALASFQSTLQAAGLPLPAGSAPPLEVERVGMEHAESSHSQ